MAAPSYVANYQPNTLALMSGVESAIAQANTMARANSARSSMMAREQREWQEVQNAKAMDFNAREAEKSRNWQEYMSNTAHQREIADLKAAGLNPVLSAMGGNGAAVTSGATASGVTSAGAKGEVDTSANQAIVNLLGSMIGYMSNLAATSVSAQASMANAEKAAEVNKFIGQLSAWASEYSADQHRAASEYSANKAYLASKYGSDMQWKIENYFPDNVWNAGGVAVQAASRIWNDFIGSDFAKGASDLVSGFGSWLKKTFVAESTFKKIYNSMDKNVRDKFAQGYYSGRR